MSIETIIESMRRKSDQLRIAHDDRFADVITVYADDLQAAVDGLKALQREIGDDITRVTKALHNEIDPP